MVKNLDIFFAFILYKKGIDKLGDDILRNSGRSDKDIESSSSTLQFDTRLPGLLQSDKKRPQTCPFRIILSYR